MFGYYSIAMQRNENSTLFEDVKAISIADYDYPLPTEHIAQHPCEPRDAARLLVDNSAVPSNATFSQLNDFLPPGAQLVLNDSKVIHARLAMQRSTGGRFELFLLAPIAPAAYDAMFSSRSPVRWKCLMGHAQRWRSDIASSIGAAPDTTLHARRLEPFTGGEGVVELSWDSGETLAEILNRLGKIPIPPYLGRDTTADDAQWYQTVYARHEGSVAAPTAGLHLSEPLLASLQAHGHPILRATLHVGAGTFLPVKGENISEHNMHSERIVISRELLRNLLGARTPIVAVGTTSMRTLESLYWIGAMLISDPSASPLHLPQWLPYQTSSIPPRHDALYALLDRMDTLGLDALEASTALCIAPGYGFRIVDALITNFHQPKSTLLLLVAALIGKRWRTVYEYALQHDYRFLSYGDAMLLFNPKSTAK